MFQYNYGRYTSRGGSKPFLGFTQIDRRPWSSPPWTTRSDHSKKPAPPRQPLPNREHAQSAKRSHRRSEHDPPHKSEVEGKKPPRIGLKMLYIQWAHPHSKEDYLFSVRRNEDDSVMTTHDEDEEVGQIGQTLEPSISPQRVWRQTTPLHAYRAWPPATRPPSGKDLPSLDPSWSDYSVRWNRGSRCKGKFL